MASIYQLKSAFQNVLRPLTRALAAAHITANHVTLAALALSCLVGGVIAAHPDRTPLLLLLPGTLFIRMALNAIDGMLAREHNMKTRLGAVLNELGDVVADSALYLPLALVPAFNHWLVVGLVILAVMVEMVGVVAIQIGASRNYAGPMGKSDRAFAFGLIALLLGLGVAGGAWVTAALSIMLLLSLFTIYNRARLALREDPR
ncbi:MAG: CDP-alcohol phosphatidyltransferase family protein [Nitrospira sp. CG24D]|jgi:CDP-diacylglycerol--glycerol-3-phosphate 3-phosphatidyltransferase|nr:MAG: CDP-alcohol phosphatidyltransferase family protein [Nitrospira sp. CG24D]